MQTQTLQGWRHFLQGARNLGIQALPGLRDPTFRAEQSVSPFALQADRPRPAVSTAAAKVRAGADRCAVFGSIAASFSSQDPGGNAEIPDSETTVFVIDRAQGAAFSLLVA